MPSFVFFDPSNRLATTHQRHSQTDRQTDRQTGQTGQTGNSLMAYPKIHMVLGYSGYLHFLVTFHIKTDRLLSQNEHMQDFELSVTLCSCIICPSVVHCLVI